MSKPCRKNVTKFDFLCHHWLSLPNFHEQNARLLIFQKATVEQFADMVASTVSRARVYIDGMISGKYPQLRILFIQI